MLAGNIKNLDNFRPYLEERLKKALDYIAATDFSKVADGEYEIEGRVIFARVNTYFTEPKSVRRPEKHNKYIDVQFVARGSETVWFTALDAKCTEIENNSETGDVIFYVDPGERGKVGLKAGDFAVFFPWELHRPNCIAEEAPVEVKKVVVKVLAY